MITWNTLTGIFPFAFLGAPSDFPARILKLHSLPWPMTRETAGMLPSLPWRRSSPRSHRWQSTFQTTSPTWWVRFHLQQVQSGKQIILLLWKQRVCVITARAFRKFMFLYVVFLLSALPTRVHQVLEGRGCPVTGWVVVSQLTSSMRTLNLKMTRKLPEATVLKYGILAYFALK